MFKLNMDSEVVENHMTSETQIHRVPAFFGQNNAAVKKPTRHPVVIPGPSSYCRCVKCGGFQVCLVNVTCRCGWWLGPILGGAEVWGYHPKEDPGGGPVGRGVVGHGRAWQSLMVEWLRIF